MVQNFKEQLIDDMDNVFLSESDFGEIVTLVRNNETFRISALYDEPSLDGSEIGAEVEAISHRPRLIVNSARIPDGVPRKGDRFILEQNPLHSAGVFVAVEFVCEKDGSIAYELEKV